MIRLNLLAIGLVSILALTGCKTEDKSTTAVNDMGKAASNAAGSVQDKANEAGKAATDAAGGLKDKADAAGKAATDAAGGLKDKADAAGKTATDAASNAASGVKDKADEAGKAASNVAGAVKGKMAAVSGLTSLSGVVNNTKTAVNAGNFDKAKTEIAKFDGYWTKVKSDTIKSPTDSSAIETNIKNAKSAIASADKAKALEALKALGTSITTATKS